MSGSLERAEAPLKYIPPLLIEKGWKYRPCFLIKKCFSFLDEFLELNVRNDDVWVVTISKCGTTWMQELVWLILYNYNFERAKTEPLEFRSIGAEFTGYSKLLRLCSKDEDTFKAFNDAVSPRIIKSHHPLPALPYQIFEKKPKIIYVFRDPRDILVSAYYFLQNFGQNTNKSLEEYVTEELNFELETQSIFNHALEFYQLRNEPWIYYTSFERMKKNLRKEIEDICIFLNKTITEEQMQRMLKHLSFEEMKTNEQCNHKYEIEVVRKVLPDNVQCNNSNFVRKGKVGSYRDDLPKDLIYKLDDWIEDTLSPHKLTLNDLLLLN